MTHKTRLGANNRSLTPIASAVALVVMGSGIVMSAAAQNAPQPKAEAQQAAPAPKPVLVAQATAAPAAAAPAASNQPSLTSIVVTANRRIEKLEKVPQSISVIGTEDIERNNVREFQDLVDLAPALTISTGTQVGTNSINMRGIGTTSNNLGIEGDVAVILDDVPFAQPQQAFKDLHDVARIEVLKGPQSTLFGKSAIAGAILITTAPIGSGPLRGKFSTYLTSDHEYRVNGTISGRITEKVGLRVSASKSDFRGLLRNLTDGSYTNGSEGENVNAKVEWQLTKDLDASLTGFYSDSVTEGNTNALIFWDGRDGSLIRNNPNLTYGRVYAGITPSRRNRDVRLDSETSLAQKDWGGALRFNYSFPSGSALADHVLTSVTGFNSNDANDRRDNDSHDLLISQYLPLTNAAGVTGTTPSGILEKAEINATSFIKTYTQDLRLTSPDSGNFRYLFGLWYSHTSLERFYLRGTFGLKPTNFTRYDTTSLVQNAALYTNTTWQFRPGHTLTLGGRINQETNNYSFTTFSALASTAPANTPYRPFLTYTAPENKESAFTGKLAYSYDINPDSIVYGAYSTGRKGVAYDMTSGANNPNVFNFLPLAAETAQGIELGFKSNLWNNRATVSFAAFHTRFDNYQTSSTQTFSDGSSASVLSGINEVQTQGFEIEAKALLSAELTLSASYTYAEATVKDWPFALCYSTTLTTQPTCTATDPRNPGTRTVPNGENFNLPNAPAHKGSVSLQYNTRLGGLRSGFFVQARSQSAVTGNINQNPNLDRPGHTVVDLGMSLATPSNAYKVSLGVKNLFDKQYATGGGGNIVNLLLPSPSASNTSITNTGWKPARDAFRYYTVRFDLNF
jgi:iron complex outermembrane recepter protein